MFLFMICNENTKTKTHKVFLTGFLLLRAVWKVLQLSQQTSSTWVLLEVEENSSLHLGWQCFHCGTVLPSLHRASVRTVSCNSQLKLLGVFIPRTLILLTVAPQWSCTCSIYCRRKGNCALPLLDSHSVLLQCCSTLQLKSSFWTNS